VRVAVQAPPSAPYDVYPSRVGQEPSVTERPDPVLHGADGARNPGPLAPPRLREFERDGFLALESVFSARETREIRTHTASVASARHDDPSPEVVREPRGRDVRSVFAVHANDPVFAAVASDRRMVAVAEQILGGPVYVHQSRVNLKPGFEGKEFFWHSDFETWHVEDGMPRMRALSCSIHLDHNYDVNGPLMLMRGSHRYFVSCAGRTPAEHYRQSLRKQEYGVPGREHLTWLAEQGGIAAPTGAPGNVTFFDCNAMHGSNGNITPFPRSNLFIVYNSVDNALVEPFGGVPPRPWFIANRDVVPIHST
jgi:ectoine hydroxylase